MMRPGDLLMLIGVGIMSYALFCHVRARGHVSKTERPNENGSKSEWGGPILHEKMLDPEGLKYFKRFQLVLMIGLAWMFAVGFFLSKV